MSLIDATIIGSDDLRRVTRAVAGTLDAKGRFVPGATIVALCRADVQTLGEDLARDKPGDRSVGSVDVFVTLEQLGAAYLEGDGAETPLGWTELQLAPADYTEGPPGDRIEFDGRVYEVVREDPHDEPGPLLPPARRYRAEDRGAA